MQQFIKYKDIDSIENNLMKSLVQRIYADCDSNHKGIYIVVKFCKNRDKHEALKAMQESIAENFNAFLLDSYYCVISEFDPIYNYLYKRYHWHPLVMLKDSICFWTKEVKMCKPINIIDKILNILNIRNLVYLWFEPYL